MTKRELILLSLSVLYFFGGLFGASAVSQWVVNYINQNGWSLFNQMNLVIGLFLAGVFLWVLGFRLSYKRPTQREVWIGVAGVVFSSYVLTNFVLLPSEFIHIPQFMGLTILLFLALPRCPLCALLLSQMACIGDEWAQSFFPGRVLDVNDIFLNIIGMFVGLALWWGLSIFLPENRLGELS